MGSLHFPGAVSSQSAVQTQEEQSPSHRLSLACPGRLRLLSASELPASISQTRADLLGIFRDEIRREQAEPLWPGPI
jgi:hypothetical protein